MILNIINKKQYKEIILLYNITPEFIYWCETIYPPIFSDVKSEDLFRLTQLPNGIYAIPIILFRCSEYLTINFFKFDMRATMGVNIREILKNNPWLHQYKPRQLILDYV